MQQGEIGIGPISFRNGKFLVDEYQNEQNIDEKIYNNCNHKFTNVSIKKSDNMGTNISTNWSTKQSNNKSMLSNDIMENMNAEDLFNYICYDDPLGISLGEIDHAALHNILYRYHLSPEKIEKCQDFFWEMVSIVVGKNSLPLNYSLYNFDFSNIIMKHVTLNKIYYYHFKQYTNGYSLVLNKFNNSIQKYLSKLPFDTKKVSKKLCFDSYEDLLLNGKKIDNLGLLIMAIKDYNTNFITKQVEQKEDIWQNLQNLCLIHTE